MYSNFLILFIGNRLGSENWANNPVTTGNCGCQHQNVKIRRVTVFEISS